MKKAEQFGDKWKICDIMPVWMKYCSVTETNKLYSLTVRKHVYLAQTPEKSHTSSSFHPIYMYISFSSVYHQCKDCLCSTQPTSHTIKDQVTQLPTMPCFSQQPRAQLAVVVPQNSHYLELVKSHTFLPDARHQCMTSEIVAYIEQWEWWPGFWNELLWRMLLCTVLWYVIAVWWENWLLGGEEESRYHRLNSSDILPKHLHLLPDNSFAFHCFVYTPVFPFHLVSSVVFSLCLLCVFNAYLPAYLELCRSSSLLSCCVFAMWLCPFCICVCLSVSSWLAVS